MNNIATAAASKMKLPHLHCHAITTAAKFPHHLCDIATDPVITPLLPVMQPPYSLLLWAASAATPNVSTATTVMMPMSLWLCYAAATVMLPLLLLCRHRYDTELSPPRPRHRCNILMMMLLCWSYHHATTTWDATASHHLYCYEITASAATPIKPPLLCSRRQ